MSARPARLDAGALAIAADLILALILALFLLSATEWRSSGDVLPRPFVIGVLYAAPAVVGALGRRDRSRSLLLAAGLPLGPASFLSFAGATLPFLLPAALFVAASARVRRGGDRGRAPVRWLGSAVIAVLLVAAPVLVLIVLTGSGCWSTATGTACGTGLLTWPGIAVAAACLALAFLLAAFVARAAADRRSGLGAAPSYTARHARPSEPTRPSE